MQVQRIVANIPTTDVAKADAFYRDILGLELVMDHGWLRTYASSAQMTVQVGVASQGGSDTPVPDLSIEVDDRATGLGPIAEAVAQWSPTIEAALRAHALAHLDWRHRIRDISHGLGVSTPTLLAELAALDLAVTSTERGPS